MFGEKAPLIVLETEHRESNTSLKKRETDRHNGVHTVCTGSVLVWTFIFHHCTYKPELQSTQHIQWFTCKHMFITQFLHTMYMWEVTLFTCYTFIHIMQPLTHIYAAPVVSVPVRCTEVTWYCIAQ